MYVLPALFLTVDHTSMYRAAVNLVVAFLLAYGYGSYSAYGSYGSYGSYGGYGYGSAPHMNSFAKPDRPFGKRLS